MKRYFLPIVFALGLAGCDQSPKFDASSQEAFEYSGEKILDALPKDKKQEFMLAADEIYRYSNVATGGRDRAAASRMYLTIFDGKTVDEVIKESKELKVKTDQKLKERSLSK